ncbi:hypothetical protein BCV70DRAFT_199909 [Testicularia cyperi]|uniref:protein O-GlcNAc transferase n=1 Tax=Testicularia cyperi TaxID=1882483 RepID=A0A317XTL9_9BASI|nr:hypothetical protein BCV70DRAFT_199909 [Testicularia cyperi]
MATGFPPTSAALGSNLGFASQRRGSEQPQIPLSLAEGHHQQRRASLGHVGPPASAHEMLRAASAMAAQASSGAEGLQAVSSALLSQAKAQAISSATASAVPSHDTFGPAAQPMSTPMSKTWSGSANYSAAMSAHIASTLEHQMSQSANPSESRSSLSAPIVTDIDPLAPLPDSADPTVQMGHIAAKAAAIEAQTQWRTQVALRSVAESTSIGAETNSGTDHTSMASTSALSSNVPVPVVHEAHMELRGNSGSLAAEAAHVQENGKQATPSSMSVSEYLEFLGLSHIRMPTEGVEQPFGRSPAQPQHWDAVNMQQGFSLSGVPSMPLMPTPPLQMLPPPASPSFRHRQRRMRGGSWSRNADPTSTGALQDSIGDDDAEPNVMSPFPYPFQVVQTPGGTARAGWWVPPSEVSPDKKARATRLPTSTNRVGRMLPSPSDDPCSQYEDQSKSTPDNADVDQEAFFQPSYRDFTSDEYSTLATAAAYATAALTSIASTPGSGFGAPSPSWRYLKVSEQEAIAAQLRAWAGLEGPERQEAARRALEERQLHIISSATKRTLPGASEGAIGPKDSTHPENAARFFPPDFASHYRAQLQALAEGYYTRLHHEALLQNQFALPASTDAKDTKVEQAEASGTVQWQSRVPQARMPDSVSLDCPPVSTPELGPGAQDPVELLGAASNAAGCEVSSPEVRDQLLQYAHGLYTQGNPNASPKATGIDKLHPTLLPLLHTLHKLHPDHLPTLLLLSCAYYAAENYAGSLWYNNLILRIDPKYVESMSNIGTTLRALGRFEEAESWWWRAIRLRPGYWDAYENLLGVMCSPTPRAKRDRSKSHNDPVSKSQADSQSTGPRFREALQLCEFVEKHVVGSPSTASDGIILPQHIPPHLPLSQAPRLQNLFYAKGNLRYVLPDDGAVPAAAEYQKAVEVALSPDASSRCSLRDLVVAACAVGLLSMGARLPGTAAARAAMEVASSLGIDPSNPDHAALLAAGAFGALCPGGILALVRASGDVIIATLLRLGNGQLPMLMLIPEAAGRLCQVIFADTAGALPGLAKTASGKKVADPAGLQRAQSQAAQTTSTILLTLAKLYQDATASPMPGPHGPLVLGGIPPSISLLLPLYYLSIAMHPSASTCNNLGILLSSIPVVTTVIDAAGRPQQLNGQALAMQYYTRGLQLDPRHPHIYTNLGSLLKDLGHLAEAIKMYEKAVECNPTFDVALANLGNAIKDQGRTQDSVVYYRRAVEVNPNFPEALCGLVNALLAVCDWREVYVDGASEQEVSQGAKHSPGWMKDVSRLVSKQLEDGCRYGAGAFQTAGSLESWVLLLVSALDDQRPEAIELWTNRLKIFYDPSFDRVAASTCEGGYLIQLIERATRRLQRKWYLDSYGIGTIGSANLMPQVRADAQHSSAYVRPKLPSCLIAPAVPTVLPFHTFTYPLSPRQIRLICHRNAIRISQNTLTQMWLPDSVYPPPAPPAPKINVGYISSDFNNHPLAHLMQSVFGFHDLSRFNVFLYATTPSDNSPYRLKIEKEAQHFVDASAWSNQQIVERVVLDGIHVLVNLNGYTKGARNEVFAARPCPVQVEFMGFAGSMASRWTDWIVADPIVCPPEMTSVDRWRQGLSGHTRRSTDLAAEIDPEEPADDWVYSDRFIYMPHSYFVNDHRQGFRETADVEQAKMLVDPAAREEAWAVEEAKRYAMRKELFPNLPDDYVIFADFNQLYKCDPMLFKLWLRILQRVPKSILWLLRFPASGEPHLLREARSYAGDEVASRVIFTDVAPKHIHIHRGRIADLFLDTTECNAHTTAADILWSATPVLTWPRHLHKMCSRVAASIVHATGFGDQMTVQSEQEYEDRAVSMALSLQYRYLDEHGRDVAAVMDADVTRFASDLEADPKSVAAQPHAGSTAAAAAAARAAQAAAASGISSRPSTTADSASKAATPRVDASDTLATHTSETPESGVAQTERARSVSVLPPSPAPAPAGVSLAQAAKFSDANPATDPVLAASIPPRNKIRLPPSPTYPGAVTRRLALTQASGSSMSLGQLRKSLFLTREAESKLFDTRQWVADLEKGYREAWTRWVLGVDSEDAPETAALDPSSDLGRRIKASGHIWVDQL